jgi:hypothetical protein
MKLDRDLMQTLRIIGSGLSASRAPVSPLVPAPSPRRSSAGHDTFMHQLFIPTALVDRTTFSAASAMGLPARSNRTENPCIGVRSGDAPVATREDPLARQGRASGPAVSGGGPGPKIG